MWRISKQFECDYGHRVHAQKLNAEYSIDNCLVCRHLHGHRMSVKIELEGETLDDSSMVTDFKHLNWFKQFIDTVIDHKFIIDINDPLFEQITNTPKSELIDMEYEGAKFKIVPLLDNDPIGNELRESFVVVDFVPTSEEIARWFYDIASKKMAGLGVKVSSVIFNETPKSQSIYMGAK